MTIGRSTDERARGGGRTVVFVFCCLAFVAAVVFGSFGLNDPAYQYRSRDTAELETLGRAIRTGIEWLIALVLFSLAFVQRGARRSIQFGMAAVLVLLSFGSPRFAVPDGPQTRTRPPHQASLIVEPIPKSEWTSAQIPPVTSFDSLRFGSELDSLAPLGKTPGNVVDWFIEFSPKGKRFSEWREAEQRLAGAPNGIRVLPMDDPLLREAESSMDRTTCRFFPDADAVTHADDRKPNIEMIKVIGQSMVDRGSRRNNVGELRVALRLARLLRQDDFSVEQDRVSLNLAYAAASMIDATLQMNNMYGWDYTHDWQAHTMATALTEQARLMIRATEARLKELNSPADGMRDETFTYIINTALKSQDRRFRVAAVDALVRIRSSADAKRQPLASVTLLRLRSDADPLLSAYARLVSPGDGAHHPPARP